MQDLDSGVIGRFWCVGRPRTKGSLKPLISRNGRGQLRVVLQEQTEHSKPWKQAMIRAIQEQVLTEEYPQMSGSVCRAVLYTEPVEVRAVFFFERERSTAARTAGQVIPSHAGDRPISIDIGDLDKLERNLLDALTQSGLIKDDAQVVRIGSEKRWAADGRPAGVQCHVLAVDPAVGRSEL